MKLSELIIALCCFSAGLTIALLSTEKMKNMEPMPCVLPAMTEEDQRLLAAMEANITYGQGLRRLLARHRLYRRGENEHITPDEMEQFTRAAIQLYKTGE